MLLLAEAAVGLGPLWKCRGCTRRSSSAAVAPGNARLDPELAEAAAAAELDGLEHMLPGVCERVDAARVFRGDGEDEGDG